MVAVDTVAADTAEQVIAAAKAIAVELDTPGLVTALTMVRRVMQVAATHSQAVTPVASTAAAQAAATMAEALAAVVVASTVVVAAAASTAAVAVVASTVVVVVDTAVAVDTGNSLHWSKGTAGEIASRFLL